MNKDSTIYRFTIDQIGIIVYNSILRGLESDSKRGRRASKARVASLLKSLGISVKAQSILFVGVGIDSALEKCVLIEVEDEKE